MILRSGLDARNICVNVSAMVPMCVHQRDRPTSVMIK